MPKFDCATPDYLELFIPLNPNALTIHPEILEPQPPEAGNSEPDQTMSASVLTTQHPVVASPKPEGTFEKQQQQNATVLF